MSKKGILIGVAGGTGSGKTSIAKAITKAFGKAEVALIEQDAYYKDLSHLSFEDRVRTNFDHPDSIDFALLKKHVKKLISGDSVSVPVYDFKTHSRTRQTHELESHHIVVLEGIFALYDSDVRAMMDIKIYVDTEDDIRLLRRLTRDLKERGRTLESVIEQYVSTVRPMHIQFVEPTKRHADLIVPEGGNNTVAVDLMRTKIKSVLAAVKAR
jgi:uridine kinase